MNSDTHASLPGTRFTLCGLRVKEDTNLVQGTPRCYGCCQVLQRMASR